MLTLTDAIQTYHQAQDAKAQALNAYKRGEASIDALKVADRRASRARLRYLEILTLNCED